MLCLVSLIMGAPPTLLQMLHDSNYLVKVGKGNAIKVCLLTEGQQGTGGKDVMAPSCRRDI